MLLTCEPGEQNDAMSVWMTEGSSDNGLPVEQTQQHSQTNTQRCLVKGLISQITGFSLPFSDARVWCTTDFVSKPRIYITFFFFL